MSAMSQANSDRMASPGYGDPAMIAAGTARRIRNSTAALFSFVGRATSRTG